MNFNMAHELAINERNLERRVKDSIHGLIEFKLHLWKYIDNPVFQRLKNLMQLGSLYSVFPGATHTRFSHSLGVGHLSQKQMRFLQKIKDRETPSLT